MADFDADDFDIDELLDELDSSGNKGKDGKSASSETDKKSAGPGGGNKSVRFSDDNAEEGAQGDTSSKGGDDYISKLPRSQREPPSASLRTMFFADKPTTNAGQSSPGTKSTRPTSGQTRGRSSAGTASISSSDWLGIQDGKGNRSRSPSNSPPPPQRSKAHAVPSRGSSGERNKSGNSSEEENALFQDIGIPLQTRRSTAKPSNPSQPPPSADPKPSQTPRSRPGTGATGGDSLNNPGGGPSFSSLSSKPTFSSSYLDQLGMNSPTDSPKTSLDLNKPSFGPSTTLSKQNPLPSTASLLGANAPLHSQPVIIPPAQESPNFPLIKPPSDNALPSFSLTAPSAVPQATQEKNSVGPQKKKALKKDNPSAGSALGVSSTLQLPIHLINEEELKAMSSSLKTLYANQLDMLEKSYKEQMNFLNEANHRKEELLKEEMKGMQMDYEERLERLRNEIRELENTKNSQFKASLQPQDLEALQNLTEKLNATLTTLQDTTGKSGSTNEEIVVQIQNLIQASLDKNMEKMASKEDKIYDVVKSLDGTVTKSFSLMNEAWKNLVGQVKNNMNEVMSTALQTHQKNDGKCHAEIEKELERLEGNLTGSLEKVGKNLEETGGKNSQKVIGKLNESERSLINELSKISKLQRKIKENTDGISLEPIVKVLESDRDEDPRRRERLAQSLKEMRRDIKRMALETETRQESFQKLSMSSEVELKSISQSIRDLNSQLKFSIISGPDTMSNQFNASMQQTQAEMEMKLLREERQALSDTMAQVNVEKRKLSEDRIELEKQKLDFQKDKDRIKNLEIQLKTKIDETEEMQKKTESVRREELQITSEAQVKLKDLEREKGIMRDKLMEAEHKLRAWEQKLRQEKLELVRERQFIDKLREQLLCPACMKQNASAEVLHPPPPPYISNETGFIGNSNFTDEYINSRINAMGGTGGGGTGDTNELFDMYYRRYFD